MEAMKISVSALNVEWQRLHVIADNLANMNTVRSASEAPFIARSLVSGPAMTFSDALQSSADKSGARGIEVYRLSEQSLETKIAYQPEHPAANADGFVAYPSVNHTSEMVDLVKSSRVYEANLTAFSIARQMYTSAMQMGRD